MVARALLALQGLISGVPTGALVMLDLYAEVQPQWARKDGFFGAPYIWCMLHNFGGNLGAPPARAPTLRQPPARALAAESERQTMIHLAH